jgi:endonuclease/exonuclease/phosphatase family metal-dependent hydrolase
MKALVLVATSIFFAPVEALAQPDVMPSKTVKVLSWNIFMLPGFIGQGKIPRADAIGKILAATDYDVIVFQEAFHHKARKKISRLLQPAYPFQAGPANQKLFSLKTNSGIWIFSKFPIEQSYSIIFKTRQGIDAFARKGALLIDLKIGNQSIQIAGTHLQNGGSDGLRSNQCKELYSRLLKKHERLGVPQIVCGDFNIDRYRSDKEYQDMLQTLNAVDGTVFGPNAYSYDRVRNDLTTEAGSQLDLIDYVLIRSNSMEIESGSRKIHALQHPWSPSHKDLSDHFAVEAEISLPGQQPAIASTGPALPKGK